jgi:hypothetical protein
VIDSGVRYTQCDGLNLAHRAYGSGPHDVVVFPALGVI